MNLITRLAALERRALPAPTPVSRPAITSLSFACDGELFERWDWDPETRGWLTTLFERPVAELGE